ncbi:MAG: hypothetical protein DI536_15360 [Archangium gephyra]|uniref:Tryptophan synthase alpha chain n=1 Tax=Archangium gephyra TaxID=48 RepID=A0A2W5T9T7_9BACT|nr:MAG: hypothetical protein DI536_15360 [Archangium gephyra]
MKALRLFVVSLFVAFASSSCGTTTTGCNANTCEGCCDATGSCQPGGSINSCGVGGAACQFCVGMQVCTVGQCVAQSGLGGGSGTGGGSGSTGGGSATTGGGSGTTDGGACGPGNCAGCCSQSGACVLQQSANRCGTNGDRCEVCPGGNSCNAGVCTPCNGCIDSTTGACAIGTAVTACGTGANACQVCDAATQACVNGACVSANCDATNCNGCCEGTTCVLPGMMSAVRCGQGANGLACVPCDVDQTCNASSRTCQAGPPPSDGGLTFPGLDGGFPGFGDGGFDLCGIAGRPCGAGSCCDFSLAGPTCISPGTACMLGGTCQASGQCG